MNMLTQEYFLMQVKNFKISELKVLVGRQRLKFNINEISYYLYQIYLASINHCHFIDLYDKDDQYEYRYNNYMKNLVLFSKLYVKIFIKHKEENNIKLDKVNALDSTILETKEAKSITKKDFASNSVTVRKKNKLSPYTCGKKLFVFINSKKQIYHAEMTNINFSDFNYLKDIERIRKHVDNTLLVDRGFSSELVRSRINRYCSLISPYKKKQKKTLTLEEKSLYKQRWNIEKVFSTLKNKLGKFKLNLYGKYSLNLKKAKVYATLINYNQAILS